MARADSEPVYHVFPLRVPDRDGLQAYLDAHGVGTGVHYKTPAHRQPALADQELATFKRLQSR